MRRVSKVLIACAVVAASAGTTVVAAAGAASATVPTGTPYVAVVGDSYSSGEAGRWAGNTSTGQQYVDALGATAYFDNPAHTAALIPGCDRSLSDEAYIGGGVGGVDLACSGATTATQAYSSGNDFKPGLDFYDDGAGHQGQAKLLQAFAATHRVSTVVVSIGGNDFNFASFVTDCVEDFLYSPTWWKDYCNDDSSVTSNFTSSNVSTVTAHIRSALLNVRQALLNDGYTDGQFTILVQDYPSPIPNGSGFRYGESGYTRQSTGGCGFWNNDANWANGTALPTINNAVKNAATQTGLANVKVLDIAAAFNGHRLCENTVNRLQDTAYTYWSDSGAVNALEWFQGIRTATAAGTDYQIQESLHPDYWAQLGLRSCVRQAYNSGAPKGGTCKLNGSGLTTLGEPKMLLS